MGAANSEKRSQTQRELETKEIWLPNTNKAALAEYSCSYGVNTAPLKQQVKSNIIKQQEASKEPVRPVKNRVRLKLMNRNLSHKSTAELQTKSHRPTQSDFTFKKAPAFNSQQAIGWFFLCRANQVPTGELTDAPVPGERPHQETERRRGRGAPKIWNHNTPPLQRQTICVLFFQSLHIITNQLQPGKGEATTTFSDPLWFVGTTTGRGPEPRHTDRLLKGQQQGCGGLLKLVPTEQENSVPTGTWWNYTRTCSSYSRD